MYVFMLWAVGNLILPGLPVLLVWAIRRLSSRPPTLREIARDGVLFFYIFTLAAILLMDAAKFLLERPATSSPGFAVAAIAVCVPILFGSAGAYLAMALANAGAQDKEGDTFNLDRLAGLSCGLSLAAAIMCAIFRLFAGMY